MATNHRRNKDTSQCAREKIIYFPGGASVQLGAFFMGRFYDLLPRNVFRTVEYGEFGTQSFMVDLWIVVESCLSNIDEFVDFWSYLRF